MKRDIERKENGLQGLFIHQLRDLYSAEQQLVRALPKMAMAASSPELKIAFQEHLQATEGHVSRLEKIFQELDQKPTGVKCKAMEGLVAEGEEAVKEKDESPDIKDANLIAAAQRVEHYEIAGYGTVRTYADLLGLDDAAQALQETLDEEGEADKELTGISETLLSSYAVK